MRLSSFLSSIACCALLACNRAPEALPFAEPVLTLDQPAPASWHPEGTLLVHGTARNLSDLRVNSESIQLDNDAFQVTLPVERGIQVIEASGIDQHGDARWTRHGTIIGDFRPPGSTLVNATDIRLNRSGVFSLFEMAGTLVEPSLINASLTAANPVYKDTFLATNLSLSLDVNSIDFSHFEILPTLNVGSLDLTMTLQNMVINTTAHTIAAGNTINVDSDILADSVEITGRLSLDVNTDNELVVNLSDVNVLIDAFSFNTSVLPSEISSALGSTAIEQALADQIALAIEEQLPPVVADLLAGFDLSYSMELLGKHIDTSARFNTADVQPEGISVGLDIGVKAQENAGYYYEGSLSSNNVDAVLDANADLVLSMSDDLINLSLFEGWRAGMMALSLNSEDGSLTPLVVDQLGANTATMEIQANLPPVLIERNGGLELQMAELMVDISTPGGALGEHNLLAAALWAPVSPTVRNGQLALTLGSPKIELQVRDTSSIASHESITRVVEEALPLNVILALIDTFSFPLPEFGGISVDTAVAYREVGGNHTNLAIELK